MLNGKAPAGTSYTYDAQNRITKIRDRNYVFERVTTISYNDQFDKAEERTTITGNFAMTAGSFTIDENGNLIPGAEPAELPDDLAGQSDVRYAYQYDSFANWTEQTVTHHSESNEYSDVRRRKLTYY